MTRMNNGCGRNFMRVTHKVSYHTFRELNLFMHIQEESESKHDPKKQALESEYLRRPGWQELS